MDFTRGALVSLILAISIVTLHELEYNESITFLPSKYHPRFRRASKPRLRARFEIVTAHLSDDEFRHAFRLSRRAFNRLLILLLPDLRKDDAQARKSSSGSVSAAVRLAITLRILAGGLHHDQILSWKVGRSTVYSIFKETILAINRALPMPGLPLDNEPELQKLATGFTYSRRTPNPLPGCVAVVDGIAVTIRKPQDSGNTHDSVAFEVSQLAADLRSKGLPAGYWIAGDPAYVCANGLLTPWAKSKLLGPRGLYCDSFNFFHSSHRIHVEQAFGILVRRWGILWRPLSYALVDTLPIVSAAMHLHNFAIDEDAQEVRTFGETRTNPKCKTPLSSAGGTTPARCGIKSATRT